MAHETLMTLKCFIGWGVHESLSFRGAISSMLTKQKLKSQLTLLWNGDTKNNTNFTDKQTNNQKIKSN